MTLVITVMTADLEASCDACQAMSDSSNTSAEALTAGMLLNLKHPRMLLLDSWAYLHGMRLRMYVSTRAGFKPPMLNHR